MSSQPSNTMLMQRLPWIIAAVAVLALVALLASGRGGSDGDAEMRELRERLQALEGGNGNQAPAGRRPSGAGMAASPTGPDGLPGASSSPLDRQMNMTPEQQAAERKQELERLEAAFKSDPPDPVGGGQVERKLEQTVTGETMKGTGIVPDDVAIDCKRSSCRIVADFAKAGDAQDWGLFYLTAAAPNLSRANIVMAPGANGMSQVRVYASRGR